MDSLAPKASYTRHEAFADEADDYLDKHNIYQLFSQLYQQLVIQRPADPISYLISQLEESPAQDLRVIIAGPRGSDKDEYVNRLASDLHLTILNTEELIKRELTTDSSLSKQLKPLNDAKQTIPDDMLISLIAQAVNDPRVRKYGWILTDYPRTRHQAQLLQSSGILCNHFFLLQKPGSGSQDETKLKKKIDERPEYRQIATFLDLYMDVLHYIDDTRQNEQTYGEIKTIVTKTPTNNAPKRPMRILLLGKKGAGKATQATLLARRFGIIPISVGALLRTECERSQEIREQVEPFLKEGWLVPDKIVIPLVSARLLSSDARTRGWVLDGYPRTLAQAQALTQIHIVPNRCIILDVKDDIANERVIHRRHDPLTGDVYHLKHSPPALSISSRLIHKVEDTAPILQAINASYQGSEQAIRAHYGDIVRVFDANSSHQQTTAEAIQEFLLAPLTSKPKV